MTTNGVCIDRWYVMIIFSCLTRTVSMHFDGLFDCSKGHFNRQSLKAVVRSQVVLNCISKENIGLTLREGGLGGGGRSARHVDLTLSSNKSIFRRPLNPRRLDVLFIKMATMKKELSSGKERTLEN